MKAKIRGLKDNLKGKDRRLKMIYFFVLLSFILPVGYLVCRIIMIKGGSDPESGRTVADYTLMLTECLLGIVAIHIPSFLERRFRFELPTVLYVMFIVFLYCAIFLGEVGDFFYRVPHWDDILHGFSSMMAGTFGFIVVALLNREQKVAVRLSPVFLALFAFCFAAALGALWEIYEFAFDGILGLNMQKFRLADGTLLIGRDALSDTMKDIIVDCCGALAASVSGFLSIRNGRGWFSGALKKYSDTETDSQKSADEVCLSDGRLADAKAGVKDGEKLASGKNT